MHLGIDFWKDFGGFLEEKWKHVGIKIEQKSIKVGFGSSPHDRADFGHLSGRSRGGPEP